MNKLFIP